MFSIYSLDYFIFSLSFFYPPPRGNHLKLEKKCHWQKLGFTTTSLYYVTVFDILFLHEQLIEKKKKRNTLVNYNTNDRR